MGQQLQTSRRTAAASRHRAVQEDVAVTVVDWHVVHAWTEGDPGFVGAVTVLDGRGAEVLTTGWASPSDRAADASLTGVGWERVGPWERDWEGRRSAPVTHLKSQHPWPDR